MLQQLSCLSGLGRLDDVVVADCVAADDGPCPCPCLLHSALCCPDDSLDDGTFVFEFIEDDHELLRDLAVAASLPPPTAAVPVAGHGQSQTTAAGHVVVTSRKRARSSSVSVTRGTWSWSSSLDMVATASVPTRRRTPNNNRRGSNNGVRRQQQQGLVSRRPRSTRRRVHQRACSHCGSTETPHWRAGPDGPATLCNACGIRYTREQSKLLPPPPPPPEHLPAAVVGEPEQEGVVRPREKKAKKIR